MKPLRIAVYAPAKNEVDNVRGWAESARDADAVVLTDTGSTDGTVEAAEALDWVTVQTARIVPWRFDDGFNVALFHVPEDIDICIALHLDERLEPGWRDAIQKASDDHLAATGSRPRQMLFHYEYAPEITFRHDRIHAREGFRWTGAAHEALVNNGEYTKVDSEVRVTQHQDPDKDRSGDDALIELAWREDPDNPRTIYYMARQHFYRSRWEQARAMFMDYLNSPRSTFDQERAEACLKLAEMVWEPQKERWYLRACYEAPQRREPWAYLAAWYGTQGMALPAAGAAARALQIRERRVDNQFHAESWCWDDTWLERLVAAAGAPGVEDEEEGSSRQPSSGASGSAAIPADSMPSSSP